MLEEKIKQDFFNIKYDLLQTTLNDKYFKLELRKAFLIATSRFIWKNLPEEIPISFIEEFLFYEDRMLGIRKVGNFYIMGACSYERDVDYYGLSPYVLFTTMNGKLNKTCFEYRDKTCLVYKDDVILLKNNNIGKSGISTYELIEPYLYRLSNNRRVKDNATLDLQNEKYFETESRSSVNEKSIRDKIIRHFKLFIFSKKTGEGSQLTELNKGVSNGSNLDSLDASYMFDFKEMLKILGINTVSYEKKERLITAEADAERMEASINLEQDLKKRQNFCDLVNYRFGLNISVELSEEAKLTLINTSNEQKEDSNFKENEGEEEL